MTIAEVIDTKSGQTVRVPDEFRFSTDRVSVRRVGDALLLEPIKAAAWPEGFFDSIAILDPAFARPEQGSMQAQGQPIGPYDVLLAGHAIHATLVLVTANTSEFSRVPGLTIENWEI